jgi:hypothetical protein
MARVLSLNQIAVSDDFPADEFEAVHRKLGSAYAERDEYRVFIMGALNAIAYRFTALAEYDESLRSLINAPNGQPFRYMQEREIRAPLCGVAVVSGDHKGSLSPWKA